MYNAFCTFRERRHERPRQDREKEEAITREREANSESIQRSNSELRRAAHLQQEASLLEQQQTYDLQLQHFSQAQDDARHQQESREDAQRRSEKHREAEAYWKREQKASGDREKAQRNRTRENGDGHNRRQYLQGNSFLPQERTSTVYPRARHERGGGGCYDGFGGDSGCGGDG